MDIPVVVFALVISCFTLFDALGLIDKIGSTKGCALLHQLIQPNVAIFLVV